MSSEEGNITVGALQVPDELNKVLDEINERFDDAEDKRVVADWLNRVSDLAYENVMAAANAQCMKLPVDSEGVPCVPGDDVYYPDEPDQQFKVIAVDGANVFYDMGGGNYPTSIAISDQLAHVKPEAEEQPEEPEPKTPEDVLFWFEDNIAMVDTAEKRHEVYQRTIEMFTDAILAVKYD